MYYAQQGEDKKLEELYKRNPDVFVPFVVDVGAGDGEFLSNSRMFVETYGFGGLMIEPGQEQFDLLDALYRDSMNVGAMNVALSSQEYEYGMEKGYMGDMTHWTLDRVKMEVGSGRKTKTLSSILGDCGITEVGLLTIDAEGMDTEILRELIENSSVRPQVVIIEVLNETLANEQKKIMGRDYIVGDNVEFNQIFLSKKYEKNFNK